ncbi:hypothetical protein N8D56_06725 [Devosia sp. A8/3-2]|nr:hypothetical protein N8D56_06725 [Devosia sp. A8/3-2]
MLSDSKDLTILAALGASNAPLLGEGGEARVYALGDHRVLRLLRLARRLPSSTRAELLAEISAGRGKIGFATPEVEQNHRN